MAYLPWPSPYLMPPDVLTDFHDLILGFSNSHVTVLSTIQQVCPCINPLDLLGRGLASHLSLWYTFPCVSAAYGLNTLLCSIGLKSVNISSKHPGYFIICSQRYCSVVIGVLQVCLMLCVINLSVFVTLPVYDYPLWSVLLPSTMTTISILYS